FPIPILYHLGAGPAILHSRLVEQMHFYAGNYPLRYGRFGGGLVALETSAPALRSPMGELSVDAARASVFAAVPFEGGRGVVAAAFRRSYFELILPFIQPGIDLSYTDYQALAQYRVDDRLSLSVFFFGADDRLDQSGQLGDGGFLSEGSRSAASFDLQRLIASLRITLPSGPRIRISGMLGRDASGFDTAQPGFGLLHFSLEAFFAGWRLETELPMSPELRARAGIDINTLNARILGTAPVPPGLGELPRVEPEDAAGLGRWIKLMLHSAEQNHFAGRPVHIEAVHRLRRENARGATAIRGIWGYHGDHAPHGDTIRSLRRRVPTLTVAVDTPEASARWLEILDEITPERGLITCEVVPAYQATFEGSCYGGLSLSAPWG
ncbi:MAG: hypothetical protein EDQ89_09555, partial [Acidobacteria bacterium]